MRITAVVPTLEEGDRIGSLVDVLRTQDVEVVVCDGGSRDRTVAIAAEAGARVVRSRPGRALQQNVGARRADGDVVWFVHADVQVPTGAAGAIRLALANPTVVGGAFRTRTVADRPSRLSPLLPMADLRSSYTRLPYGDQGIFARREVFERVGGFPLQPLLEDLELSRRLSAAGEMTILDERLQVSARRFLARPFWYTTVMNLYPVLYRCGVDPQRLARGYRDER